jgi:cob(I)alamin adenosyltransferase
MKKGLVQVYFGKGKGKTTAAAGQAMRALFHGFNVFFVQFLKTEDWKSGEIQLMNRFPNFRSIQAGFSHPKFYPAKKKPSKIQVRDEQRRLFDLAMEEMGKYDMVVLDEILNCDDLLSRKSIEKAIAARPPETELVFTGRKFPNKFLKKVNLVTECKEIKHPYRAGFQARQGVEF